eukprot:5518448-Pyramimonas_sp.AAC.1
MGKARERRLNIEKGVPSVVTTMRSVPQGGFSIQLNDLVNEGTPFLRNLSGSPPQQPARAL